MPGMTDDATFLAAIAARPGDHLPLLAYADWLGERGEGAKEEFIRLRAKYRNRVDRLQGMPRDEAYFNNLSAAQLINRRVEALAVTINDPAWLASVGYGKPPLPRVALTEIGEEVEADRYGDLGYQRYVAGRRRIRATARTDIRLAVGDRVTGVFTAAGRTVTVDSLNVHDVGPPDDFGVRHLELVGDDRTTVVTV